MYVCISCMYTPCMQDGAIHCLLAPVNDKADLFVTQKVVTQHAHMQHMQIMRSHS